VTEPQLPYPPAPNYPPPVNYEARTNPTAIAAIILGFVVPVGGIIAGIIALTQIRRTAEKGRGLAIAGIVVGGLLILLTAIVTVVFIVFAGLAASQATNDSAPDIQVPSSADPFASEDAQAEDTDVFTLAIGDCFNNLPDSESVSSVGVVDCATSHDYEVYSEGSIADADAFPGDDSVSTDADNICFNSYEAFVGVSYDESTLDYSYLLPTEDSWANGDRLVSCLIFDSNGPTTGTLAGAAR
jgi:hypothetical protein